jgi:hypothetical protein
MKTCEQIVETSWSIKQATSCQHKVPSIFEKLIACLNQTPISLKAQNIKVF